MSPFSSSSAEDASANSEFLSRSYSRLRALVSARVAEDSTLPPPSSILGAVSSLPKANNKATSTSTSSSTSGCHQQESHHHGADANTNENNILPIKGLGQESTLNHLLEFASAGLNSQTLNPRYYGFVTGSTLPVAEAADNIVTALDQNVQVHLPAHSASTFLEDAALSMLLNLLNLPCHAFPARTFTTGATASNIMGLACGREAVISSRLPPTLGTNVAEIGLLAACQAASIKEIQILTSMSHSSLSKAASLVGLGHRAIKELPLSKGEPWRLDLDAVEHELAKEADGVVSIIVVSAGEVNTGRFALHALDMPKLASLAEKYRSWIHVDGAFGIFARALPRTDEFLHLHASVAGMELADSITADGHKLLNVPYDTGIFFCRDAPIVNQVFKNPNAVYLAPSPTASPGTTMIHSPLNMGIENSRRFRALPVYAVLLSEGREGMAAMLGRMVSLAREISRFIRDSKYYEWLPDQDASLEQTHIIVLFRAKDPKLNDVLTDRINETRRMFVSGTTWEGHKAVRLAVSNWRVNVERDLGVVKEVLLALAASSE